MKVAAVIYDIENNEILSGIESYYCFEEDYYNQKEFIEINKWEKGTEKEYIDRSIYLSQYYKRRIQYTEASSRTHFCCITVNSHMGIIKGNVNDNETLIDAIKREIQEETGLIIDESRMMKNNIYNCNTHIYLIPVSKEEKLEINQYLIERDKQHKGELFNVQFRSSNDLMNSKCNYVTDVCINWFKKNKFPTIDNDNKISYEDIIHSNYIEKNNFKIEPLYEPPFVWGKKRRSLLKIPYFENFN